MFLLLLLPPLLTCAHGAETREIVFDDSDDAKAEAQQILSFMNQSVLPCDDFYEFACGSYNSRHGSNTFESADNAAYGKLRKMLNNIKDTDAKYKRDIRSAFRSCMAKKFVTPEDIRKYILELGGWPLVDKDVKKLAWSSVAGKIRSQFMIEPLLSLDFQLKDKVPAAIPTSLLSVNINRSSGLKADVTKLAVELYADKCICMQDIEARAQKVQDFADALYYLIRRYEWRTWPFMYDHDKYFFHPVDFFQRFPGFQLQSFMTAFISADAWATFKSRTTISLPYSNSTIAAISALLKDTDGDTIVNYIVYTFAKALQTADADSDITYRLDANDWEEYCLKKISRKKQLGSAVVSAFYNDNFNLSMPDQFHVKRLQADMADIDVLIRQAYVEMISRSPWLPDAAKVHLNQMLLGLKHHLLLPTWPEQQLDEYYKLLNINESEPTTVVSTKILAFNSRSKIASFLADGTTPAFSVSPMFASDGVIDMNAYFDGPYYALLTGELQAPMYSSYRMPTSAKFGFFTVTGHEIGHAVDYTRIDTYAHLGWFVPDQVIADVSGLRATYLAFKAWQEKNSPGVDHRLRGLDEYSAEQVMYIKYVQSWCSTETRNNPGPYYIRPTVTINNDVEFPGLFGCNNRTRCDYLI